VKDLLLSEWRRFRRLVLVVGASHALALLFLSRATNLLQRGHDDHALMLAIYMLLGLALALLQVGSYRKPSQWLWLIHRPLPPARIFAALALSALAMLALAILVPLAAFVLATDALTTQVVDSRHYVALVHVLAFTLMAWLAGAHACVSRSRATVAVLVAPLLLALHLASVWSLLVPVLACLAWLTWIALHAFRADRTAPIARPSVLLLTALPLQLGFFLVVFQLSKVTIDVVELMSAVAPPRTVLESDPGADRLQHTFAQDFLARGLQDSRDPRAASWREQLPLLDVAGLMPDLERFPVRHQIGNVGMPRWDETRGIEWTFGHDRMLFHGREPTTGADRGWWGTTGVDSPQPFAEIPLAGMTRSTLFSIDAETQRQHELVRLPAGEWFVGMPTHALDRLLVLTNRSVLAYEPDRQARSPFAPPLLDWQLALPENGTRPVQVSIAELLDGWLVSFFVYAGPEFDGFEGLVPHWQQVVHVDDGGATVVGERRDIRGHSITLGGSPAMPEASWWLSPVLCTLGRWPGSVLDRGLTRPPRLAAWPDVPMFPPLAGALMLLSLALGAWWLRGARVGAARRRLWLATCAVIGLPAFLSLVCLEPRAPRR
jgi:hypothetical protein